MAIKGLTRPIIITVAVLGMFIASAVYWHTTHNAATARWKTYCSTSSNACIKYPPSATINEYDVYGTDSTGANTHVYRGTAISTSPSAEAKVGFFSSLPKSYTYNPACIHAPGEKCDFTTMQISNSKLPGVKIVGGIYYVFDGNSSQNTFEPGYFVISDDLLRQYNFKQGRTTAVESFNPTFANTQHSGDVQFLVGSNMYNNLAQSKAWMGTSEAQTVKLIVSSLYERR